MSEQSGERKSPEETAAYIAALAQDLAVLARLHGFVYLGQLLEMARLEAESRVEGWDFSER
jgi:hypothetical protein